jgi:SAM-dependent methyltransferase
VTRRHRQQATAGHAARPVAPSPGARLASFWTGLLDGAQGCLFDHLLGVSTRQVLITEGSVFTAGTDNCPYAGSQWLPLRRALKDLPAGPSDVFADLGSGKGKALLIAGRLPYHRVIGVEIDDELSQYSRRNIERARPRLRADHVECITASVLEWPIPDETSVVFMYNPFIGQTFHAAAGRIFESFDRRPRALHIVYRYPWEHDWLVSTGRVTLANVRPSNWPAPPRWWRSGDVIVSYRVTGASAGSHCGPGPRRLLRAHPAVQRWSRPNGHRFAMSAPGQETLYSRS